MKVVFRVDASLNIGNGHIMRCLTMANALKGIGANCQFICRKHPGNLIELVKNFEYEVFSLPAIPDAPESAIQVPSTLSPHSHWLGVDWLTDATQTLEAIGPSPPDWMIVDHYALDEKWERTLRPFCKRLLVIDDLADRPHDCDLLLDQNIGRRAEDYDGLVFLGTKLLVGPKYALLRPDFSEWRKYSLERRARPELKKLLVTMGGVDRDNATGRVLDALKTRPILPDLNITVVLGTYAPWLNEVKQQASHMRPPARLLVGISHMASVMAESDLAIGAAGSTSLERCCLGLPSIVIALADNQRRSAELLDQENAARLLQLDDDFETSLSRLIGDAIQSETLLRKLRDGAMEVTDGNGTHRVLGCLMAENNCDRP
jgi:UDP-2,4-diacetamido-2,4,6-trideoxy-beta-L-altropyranose hydrolase